MWKILIKMKQILDVKLKNTFVTKIKQNCCIQKKWEMVFDFDKKFLLNVNFR